jgi:hypothetical protein
MISTISHLLLMRIIWMKSIKRWKECKSKPKNIRIAWGVKLMKLKERSHY